VLENLDGWEILVILLLALIIFGDKLPNVIADGLRMLRNLRNMASNATSDLSRELGTDIKLEDLNPKTFVRKHLLSEEDEATLRKPLEGLLNDVKKDVQSIGNEVKGTAQAVEQSAKGSGTAASAAPAVAQQPEPPARYVDAT
jgi:sec-independent protein translocase protein TatB